MMDKVDTETEAIAANWQFVKVFLNNLKERGGKDLLAQSREIMTNVQRELHNFSLFDEDKEVVDKEILSTGARPKVKSVVRVAEDKERLTKKKLVSRISNSESSTDDSENMLKNKDKNLKKKTTNRNSVSESSDSLPYDDSSSDLSANCKTRNSERKGRFKRRSGKDYSNTDYKLVQMKTMPEFEKFREEEGHDLIKYLDRFEDFCRQSYRGSKYLWIAELEKYLTGRTLEGFKAMRRFDDEYFEIKDRLIRWYNDEKEIRKAKAKQKFRNARPKPAESAYIYSNRLETLFSAAYPRRESSSSRTLIVKFKTTVPKQLANNLSSQMLSYKMKGKTMRWHTVQKCARIFDVDCQVRDDESMGEKEIVINIGAKKYSPRNGVRFDGPNNDEGEESFSHMRSGYKVGEEGAKKERNGKRWEPNYTKVNERTVRPPMWQGQTCHTCGRFGHASQNCRMRLRLCFLCGNSQHFMRDCPYKKIEERKVRDGNSFGNFQRRSQSSRPDRFGARSNNNARDWSLPRRVNYSARNTFSSHNLN